MTAILDWGIGGVAALGMLQREFSRRCISEDIVYLSDAGFTPYGRARRHALRSRLREVCVALSKTACTRLLVACNAMSVVIPPGGMLFRGIHVEGMFGTGPEAARLAACRVRAKRVIVFGGTATVRSGRWSRPLRSAGFEVVQRGAQPLSALIESGVLGGDEFEKALIPLCPAVRPHDFVVLACTHYPAALPSFQKAYPRIVVFDPANAIVSKFIARRYDELRASAPARESSPRIWARTTGDPQSSSASAKLAFKAELDFHGLGSWAGLRESLG